MDEAVCTAQAYEAVEVPQVVQNNEPTHGAADAFAQGFINGMNQGAVSSAKKARKRVFRGCMYQKEWTDEDAPRDPISETVSPASSPALPTRGHEPVDITEIQIYESPEARWRAEVEEFLRIFHGYRESREVFEKVDARVIRIAEERPSLTYQQVFLAAHDSMLEEGVGHVPVGKDEEAFASFYRAAVTGSIVDQNALSTAYVLGLGPAPVDRQRALAWAKAAAVAGDIQGRREFGLLLSNWGDTDSKRKAGYRIIANLAASGDEAAQKLLTGMQK